MIPGEMQIMPGEIELNAGRTTVTMTVANHGDRPIQVGSHFHFFEVNPALVFDRPQAWGCRLDIAAGTAVRFEPGQRRTVTLVVLGGRRQVHGFRGAVMGALDEEGGGDAGQCSGASARSMAAACAASSLRAGVQARRRSGEAA